MRLPLSVWQDAAGMGAGLSSMGEQQVAKFEYDQWTEYTTRKGGFVRGEPVMAYFFTTETSEVLLTATSIIAALTKSGVMGGKSIGLRTNPSHLASVQAWKSNGPSDSKSGTITCRVR